MKSASLLHWIVDNAGQKRLFIMPSQMLRNIFSNNSFICQYKPSSKCYLESDEGID